MAEALKNQFTLEAAHTIARQIKTVWPAFDSSAFINELQDSFDALDLMARAKAISHALGKTLPSHFADASQILINSLPAITTNADNAEIDNEVEAEVKKDAEAIPSGKIPFLYLPHTFYAAFYGLDDFDNAMRLQYELTQRFTAEFSIRYFLEKHQQATLALFKTWATDPSEHVRRLVSEGSRPRLPWAQRLKAFQQDPSLTLELLELLKDDPSLYVRRSVANHLNDIGKDHPEALFATTARWIKNASPERLWLIEHSLRFAIKKGDAKALAILGYGEKAKVKIKQIKIWPSTCFIGQEVFFEFELHNHSTHAQNIMLDFAVHYVKANGQTKAKVFKLKTLQLASQQTVKINKKISLKEMTTRQHYAGTHFIEAVLNGENTRLGQFELLA